MKDPRTASQGPGGSERSFPTHSPGLQPWPATVCTRGGTWIQSHTHLAPPSPKGTNKMEPPHSLTRDLHPPEAPTGRAWLTRALVGLLAARNIPSCVDTPSGNPHAPPLHSPTLPSSSSILGHPCLEERAAGCQAPTARAGHQGTTPCLARNGRTSREPTRTLQPGAMAWSVPEK